MWRNPGEKWVREKVRGSKAFILVFTERDGKGRVSC